jgi:hypothetical protein
MEMQTWQQRSALGASTILLLGVATDVGSGLPLLNFIRCTPTRARLIATVSFAPD